MQEEQMRRNAEKGEQQDTIIVLNQPQNQPNYGQPVTPLAPMMVPAAPLATGPYSPSPYNQPQYNPGYGQPQNYPPAYGQPVYGQPAYW